MKRMEVRVFQVVQLCESTSTGCSQWATSLLYSLCMIFWMITMCCEISYLYIGLLTQLFYLTYVGFLNIPPQTQGVILVKPWVWLQKNSLNILAQLGLARISARWLGSLFRGSVTLILAWGLRSQLGLVESWLNGSNRDSVAQKLWSWNGLGSGSQLSGSMAWLNLGSLK